MVDSTAAVTYDAKYDLYNKALLVHSDTVDSEIRFKYNADDINHLKRTHIRNYCDNAFGAITIKNNWVDDLKNSNNASLMTHSGIYGALFIAYNNIILCFIEGEISEAFEKKVSDLALIKPRYIDAKEFVRYIGIS